ncbi:hypothetical protein Back2_19640 [Nocardioides baekrokdamisoli]|uniref:GatB/YqeY domain-containing protein n=1 Tax=Nocardioides baekrokdamisoli TaxID=1804624 RepID=A0A3G9IFF2_9ACTN|nr:GatB/YqeY domain-containing protein [Nocardioides baekrokdamisoli]BBH17677.1 hypothetical protein Back2_19640 [Nocardioides baekrokdamisoli]
MTLKERLRTDLTAAIKGRDEVRSATLRMVLAALTNAEVAGKVAKVLTDDEVISVLSTEVKKRREAATAFADGGRPESSERELAEAAVIIDYLPAQLSAEEISGIVARAIAESGATDATAMGRVMGLVTPQVKGRADGGAVAAEVRRQLA